MVLYWLWRGHLTGKPKIRKDQDFDHDSMADWFDAHGWMYSTEAHYPMEKRYYEKLPTMVEEWDEWLFVKYLPMLRYFMWRI
jgi:hypothetical protein